MTILDHIFRYVSLRRLDRFWENAKQYITDKISEIVQPSSDKEVVQVLTYAAIEPATASEGDYYIDSSEGLLYQYANGNWNVVLASKECVYITADTAHIYVYNGSVFIDSTGEAIDNTLYVPNITTSLDGYTERGSYNLCVVTQFRAEWYSFAISIRKGKSMVGRPASITYIQTLRNNSGYMLRTKVNTGDWSEWNENTYMTEEEHKPAIDAAIQEAKDWAVVGWVL